jgi:hypothetical protein
LVRILAVIGKLTARFLGRTTAASLYPFSTPLQCVCFFFYRLIRYLACSFTPGNLLRLLAYYWGVMGVIGLIASAVFKLLPRIAELGDYPFAIQHWLMLLVFTPYMAYAEGYKGFYLKLAPRVQARALYLRDAGGPFLALTAPLFCMGYFYATRRRMLTSWIVSTSIVGLVAIVSRIPQPWRGLIDVGVMAGLIIGIAALFWYWLRFEFTGVRPRAAPDLPTSQ